MRNHDALEIKAHDHNPGSYRKWGQKKNKHPYKQWAAKVFEEMITTIDFIVSPVVDPDGSFCDFKH